jgi:hypothetical protein
MPDMVVGAATDPGRRSIMLWSGFDAGAIGIVVLTGEGPVALQRTTATRHAWSVDPQWRLVDACRERSEAIVTTSIILVVAVLLLVAGVLAVVVVRPRINQWGATDAEHHASWPGDKLVTRPGFIWTNAVTIHAPVEQIWPWLAQLGQGRGGLYSYDWLENLIGCDVHSTDRILPQFQQPLRVGDRTIRMSRYAPSNPVALFEPGKVLVLGHINDSDSELAAGHARSSWAFILQPVDQGTTRLIIRCRGSSLMARLQGPIQFVMQRKMMLGVKQRAEKQFAMSAGALGRDGGPR